MTEEQKQQNLPVGMLLIQDQDQDQAHQLFAQLQESRAVVLRLRPLGPAVAGLSASRHATVCCWQIVSPP